MRANLFSNAALLTGIAILGLLVAGCGLPLVATTTVRGSGNVTTESRNVSGFTRVSLAGIGKLIVEQGSSESLTITADDNLLPYLLSDVRGGRLVLSIKNDTAITYAKEITYKVTVKRLDAVDLSGAGDMELRGISAERLQIANSGAGNISAAGRADRLDVTLSGAGNYNGENLESQEATVMVAGLGSAVVRASDRLDAQISGAGSIQYIGDPQVTQKITGIGSVSKR